MGKLNIAHHKSYHPYRRDNIEKVRKDEEEARLKEEKEEGRMMIADAEARIDLLRERAGVSDKDKKPNKMKKDREDLLKIATTSSMQVPELPTTNGHINLFEDLELNAIAAAMKTSKKGVAETEKGVALAPSEKDLNPWYSERSQDKPEEANDEKKKREEFRKYSHDPLTSITKQLASRPSLSTSIPSRPSSRYLSQPISDKPPEVQARLSREMSERERALELIRRKKREMRGSETPSTVQGEDTGGYGDVFNRREVEEAHKYRERRFDGGHRHGRNWEDRDSRKMDSRPTSRHW